MLKDMVQAASGFWKFGLCDPRVMHLAGDGGPVRFEQDSGRDSVPQRRVRFAGEGQGHQTHQVCPSICAHTEANKQLLDLLLVVSRLTRALFVAMYDISACCYAVSR